MSLLSSGSVDEGLASAPGEPQEISQTTAIALKNISNGNSLASFSSDWRRARFHFQRAAPYCFDINRDHPQPMLICVQAYALRQICFGSIYMKPYCKIPGAANWMIPTVTEQETALTDAISSILWNAGQRKAALCCMLHSRTYIDASPLFRYDGITEKIIYYEFNNYKDLFYFVGKNITIFNRENNFGAILLLYSVVLSRGIQNIFDDMGETSKCLLGPREEVTLPLICLLLCGRAVCHLFNGIEEFDRDANLLKQPLKGIPERSDVGYLYFEKTEDEGRRTEVGSMFKTPRYPVWVTCANRHFGVVFNPNLELITSWRAEHQFVLHYFTVASTPPCPIGIDSRVRRVAPRKRDEEKKVPALQALLWTKWPDCEVDWHGVTPFV